MKAINDSRVYWVLNGVESQGEIEKRLCKLLMRQLQFLNVKNPNFKDRDQLKMTQERMRRWGIENDETKKIDAMLEREPFPDTELMKNVCAQALELDKENWETHSDIAKMNVLLEDHRKALEHFVDVHFMLKKLLSNVSGLDKDRKKALKKELKYVHGLLNDLFRSVYRDNLYRSDDADAAYAIQQLATKVLGHARSYQNLGTIVCVASRDRRERDGDGGWGWGWGLE